MGNKKIVLNIISVATFIFFGLTGAYAHAGDVVINEVFVNGNPDWIELYNKGTGTVNLTNVSLSDDVSNLRKWIFPAGTTIGANQYLVVYASGTDLLEQVPAALNASFKIVQTGETISLTGADLVVMDQVAAVDLRSYGNVGVSWRRSVNGTGAFGISYTPTLGRSNQSITLVSDDIIINEIMGNNQKTLRSSIVDPLDSRNGFYGWIEFYNKSASPKALDGYKVDYDDDLWFFPAGTVIGGQSYLTVFASGKNQVVATANGPEIHTSFTINNIGGTNLFFKKPSNALIDFAYVGAMDPDRSVGRLPNGAGNLRDLTVPTPTANNQNSVANVSSIVVNEIASNDTQDWIELYNSSTQTVDLSGSYLTDDEALLTKWQFPPQIRIPARGYLAVKASSLNTLIFDNNGNITDIHTNFSIKNDGTESITFVSSDQAYTNRINKGILNMLQGQSYCRIPDGSNTFALVNSPTFGFANVNLNITPDPNAADITINEINPDNDTNLGLNLTTFPGGDKKDWIELYNKGVNAVNVNGMMLQFGNTIWTLPNRTINAGSYLLIFASGLNLTGSELHTNFTINHSEPSTLLLLNTNRAVLNTVVMPSLGHDQSYARLVNGTGLFIMNTQPSPNAANINSPVTPDTTAAANIVINEISSNNVNNINLNITLHPLVSKLDWIEMYNKGTTRINLYQLKITDTKSTWPFDKNTFIDPGQHLLVFAAGAAWNNADPTVLSANFAVSAKGETVQFLNRDNSIIQTINVPPLSADESYGLLPNGTGAITKIALPTPESANAVPAPKPNAANIVINEVVTRNLNNLSLNLTTNPGAAQQDWIELYNKGTAAVNVQGLKLADSNTAWVLPSKVMNPGDYLVVFASGRDLRGAEWHTNFSLSAAQGEVLNFLNLDNSIIQSVSVAPLATDESFSRLPNGTGNFIIVTQPSAAAANIASAVTPNPDAGNITINEVVSDNTSNVNLNLTTYPGGDHEDWIELHNKGSINVNLAGLKLADMNNNTWVLPAITLAPGQYLLVFASGRDLKGNELHTNFSINSQGDVISFRNKDNSLIESYRVPSLAPDQAFTRIPNGTGAPNIVNQPTPGAVNTSTPVPANPDAANITINEIVTNNVSNTNLNLTTYPGGNHQDWIELYNKGTIAVNLQGLKLADSINTWVFPSKTMVPGEYLLVFASGENLAGPELHTNFAISASQGDTIRFLNKDNSVIEIVPVGALNDDQSFARLPNGTGVMNVNATPSPAASNISAQVLPNANASNITINEVVTDNAANINLNLTTYPGGNHQDWIELFNKGTVAVDLQGLKLADKNNSTWVFPARTINPGGYLLIFASGNNLNGTELHANFSLSSTQGDKVQFLNKNNAVIESVVIPPLSSDQSYARLPNGTGTFVIDTQVSPAAVNINSPIAPNPNAANIKINEVLANNVNNVNLNLTTYPGGDRQDYIELYNSGAVAVDLLGLKLQDGLNNTWVLPSRSMGPGTYLLVFASGRDLKLGELHTNFSISSGGDTIRLLNKDNAVIDTVVTPLAAQDVSVARLPNAAATLGLTVPTPAVVNSASGSVAPGVLIQSPLNDATLAATRNATVTVAVYPGSGNAVTKVEFFNGSTKLGETLTAPYTFVWSNLPAGIFNLSAKVTDSAGLAGTSNAVIAKAILYGDINGDARIRALDASMAAQYSVSLIPLTPEQVLKSDVNGDGRVRAVDAALIAQRSVSLIDKFPIEP